MKERFKPYPDKKRPTVTYKEVTDFIKRGQELSGRAEITQEEGTWIPETEYKTPLGVVVMSDIHYGSQNVNYDKLDKHFDGVEDTPNMFIATNGDHTDAFSPTVLPSGMMESPISPGRQVKAFVQRIKRLGHKGKIGWMNIGNHDEWVTAAGHKPEQTLEGVDAPIFEHGGKINIITRGGAKYRGVVAHQYWGKSKLNPTNSPKRLAEYEGGGEVDFAITGHTHQSSYEQYDRGGRELTAVVAGTYKEKDRYAKNRGFGHRAGQPGLTLVFWQDKKKIQVFKDPEDAKQFVLGHAMMEDGVIQPSALEKFKNAIRKGLKK
jgi:predicted phosphodiesterase